MRFSQLKSQTPKVIFTLVAAVVMTAVSGFVYICITGDNQTADHEAGICGQDKIVGDLLHNGKKIVVCQGEDGSYSVKDY